jgi:CheY-like chemotaxis protein
MSEQKPKLILVVEDQPTNAELVREILEMARHRVVIAANAQEAMEAVRQNRPDLVLLDIGLPVVDGFQLAKNFKQMPEMADVPVIALTAHAMPEEVQRARNVGCVAHITKPFDIQKLLQIVEEHLAK